MAGTEDILLGRNSKGHNLKGKPWPIVTETTL